MVKILIEPVDSYYIPIRSDSLFSQNFEDIDLSLYEIHSDKAIVFNSLTLDNFVHTFDKESVDIPESDEWKENIISKFISELKLECSYLAPILVCGALSNNRYCIGMSYSLDLKKLAEAIYFKKGIIKSFRYDIIKTLRTKINQKLFTYNYGCEVHLTPEKYEPLEGKLYGYQERNIEWMMSVEQTQPTWYYEYSHALRLSSKYDVIFSAETETFYSSETLPDYFTKKIEHKFRGGFLADEMGCGKTACVIELVNRTLPTRAINPLSRDPDTQLISTDATLIIVPVHIIDQWAEEISKFAPRLNVIKIFNKHTFENTSYGDIASAHIVLTTYSFFSNPTFRSICYDTMKNYSNRSLETYNTINVIMAYKTLINEFVDDTITSDTKLPNIMYFAWHRIVLDECQTLSKKCNLRSMFAILHAINTKYFWHVSGTPFTSRSSLSRLVSLLVTRDNPNLKLNSENIQKTMHTAESSNKLYINFLNNIDNKHFYENQKEFRKIYRRNTKASTSHETNLSKIKISYRTELISFTNEERIIYESNVRINSSLFARQFCCCPFAPNSLSNCKSFDAIINSMIASVNEKLKAAELNKIQIEASYNAALNRLTEAEQANFVTPEIKAPLERNLKIQEENLKKIIKKNQNITSTLKFYDNLADTIKDKKTIECIICCDEEVPCEDFKVTMTKCGHMYCTECVNTLFAQRRGRSVPCPDCRVPLQLSTDTFKIGNPSSSEDELYNELGTKCAKMVRDIRALLESEENKIILFVEWDTIMVRLCEAFKKYQIDVAMCKGNKSVRDAAMNKFNSPNSNCRVIMLCSSYASSGANLTSANKIIIANPVGTNKKEREAIEAQAIARAYRLGQTRNLEVIRYVTKDTVEEMIYKKTRV